MKVLNLKIAAPLKTTEKLIRAILQRDIDAFKATNMQFLRNNKIYNPEYTGLIA
ncbi:hypothetical protein HDF18_01545 [Mucilaginibacter sp. X5P1]|uniref:hypothetical protein n=1 Tax=Mucilaginibacter sp. X5P1 TaxID=2723088 RepID=UPI001613EFC5|nr:hypothetical protein [Mucilaginibacter sp. X5P1]MBB6138208.1 hypothetical protein [Mucilaginibacter sp. X5P1]